MMNQDEIKPEEPQREQYAKFIRLLTAIVAVPKAAIYDLAPSLRPKSHPKAGPGNDT